MKKMKHGGKVHKRMQMGGVAVPAASVRRPITRPGIMARRPMARPGTMVRPGAPSGTKTGVRPYDGKPANPRVTYGANSPSGASTKMMMAPPQSPTTQAPPPKSIREQWGLPAQPSGLTREQEMAIVQEKLNKQNAQPSFELNRPTSPRGATAEEAAAGEARRKGYGLNDGGPMPSTNVSYMPPRGPMGQLPGTVGGAPISQQAATQQAATQSGVGTPFSKPSFFKKGGAVKSKAMRGGGLARKGVGMALAKGGLARRAGGCAQRGVGRGKIT